MTGKFLSTFPFAMKLGNLLAGNIGVTSLETGNEYINGWVQERRNFSALTMELQLCCTNPACGMVLLIQLDVKIALLLNFSKYTNISHDWVGPKYASKEITIYDCNICNTFFILTDIRLHEQPYVSYWCVCVYVDILMCLQYASKEITTYDCNMCNIFYHLDKYTITRTTICRILMRLRLCRYTNVSAVTHLPRMFLSPDLLWQYQTRCYGSPLYRVISNRIFHCGVSGFVTSCRCGFWEDGKIVFSYM